ncbi:hypothetical protein MMU07_10365 [Aquiflexum sp. LQ15W]|uniref:hypothetical protein n=1 Tax=Cognataquiflexum nitidum TaxID=2922272 RepID=UPI001F13B79F|nr:hypothetical protein [Cognataquiflexum nitidum]MCH6199988.1 hypothetical protein [Cognataquiflexum nitidum]
MKYLIICLFLSQNVSAQEKEGHSESYFKSHSIALLLGHTHVSQGIRENARSWLTLPSVSLDYNYLLSKKLSIGLHNDLIIENFKIEKSGSRSQIERTRPLASAMTVGFKPGNHLTWQFGLGGEFSKEENFFLSRLGVEYSHEIAENWEFISSFIYDIKWNAYDSFAIGVGLSKSFGK